MSNDWRPSTLGEVCRIRIGRTPPRKEARYWTQDLERPFCTIADMTERRIDPSREGVTEAAEAEGKAKRVPAGSLLMSFKLTIGRVGFAARDLFPNEAIAWLRSADAGLDEHFLALWLEGQDLSQGSGRAVKGATLNSDSLRAIPVMVPPIAVQRRIVDLIGSVDSHIAKLTSETGSLRDFLEQTVLGSVALPGDSAAGVAIASMLTRNIGGVWGEELPESEPGVAVFRTTEFTNWGVLSGPADAIRAVKPTQMSSRELAEGDILLEKSGGTPSRPVGRVVAVGQGDLTMPAVGANFLQLLRVDRGSADPRYLFWVLWGSHRRGDAALFQQATTNIRNLQTKPYLSRRVTLPSLEEQRRVAEAVDRVQVLLFAQGSELDASRAMRAQLLNALLSRAVEIPEAYDWFIDAGVA